MAIERLIEYTAAGRGKLDRVTSVIHGVKILGLRSKNNRDYTRDCVARAAELYEAVAVNVDHPQQGRELASRSYTDRIGTLRAVREAEGLVADLHVNPHHPLASQLFWDAENSPQSVGLSHNVQARTSRGRNGRVIVEEILKVHSVDLVADPATTTSLFESTDEREAAIERIAAEVGVPQEIAARQQHLRTCDTEAAVRVSLTDIRNVLTRVDTRRPYIGWSTPADKKAAAEFTTGITGEAAANGFAKSLLG